MDYRTMNHDLSFRNLISRLGPVLVGALLVAQASAQTSAGGSSSANGAQTQPDGQEPPKKKPLIPLLSVTVGAYLLTDSLSRQIFGDSTSFVGVGFREFARSPGSNDLVGVSLNVLHVGGASDNFFVVSPQVTYEHRFPIAKGLTAYGKLLGGPAYMDYSFDLPNGDHFGAKRFGAEGEIEVGLRYERFQLNAQYHVLTEPQDVSFNGVELSLTWIAVRF